MINVEAMSSESFERFSRRNGGRVFNYVLRMVRNREDAEDITQEVFLAVHEKFGGIAPEARDAYLFRAAYNRTVNFARSRNRNPEVQQSEFVEPATEDPPANDDTKNAAIRAAMSRLNDNERVAVDLKYFQNMSYGQIAGVLDITPAAVDSLLIRARRKLKTYISQETQDLVV
ncbi:MAG: sigma-70 family RNA polymerase sigma factor [Candidatus Cloacimonetes bacterium]|nr:sigma-70 family RNA polymerase sigma factor [Candidatus Cloacimonadota bacterium]